MPYTMRIRSAPISPAQRCTSDGGMGAAPWRIQSRLDRSRPSTPGRSATRWSMVGVAVKLVTRWRSMASTTRAASKRSSTTSRSPASRLNSVANPLAWYMGPGTRITWGRGTGRQPSMNAVPSAPSHRDGRSLRMTLGVPVEPLLQMPLTWGDTASGRSAAGSSRVASIQATSSASSWTRGSITARTRARSQSGRSQRTGTGTAPSFQAARAPSVNGGELRMPSASRSPSPRPRAASAPASRVERSSSSRQVSSVSAPSGATWQYTGSSGRSAASCRTRWAKLAPSVTVVCMICECSLVRRRWPACGWSRWPRTCSRPWPGPSWPSGARTS